MGELRKSVSHLFFVSLKALAEIQELLGYRFLQRGSGAPPIWSTLGRLRLLCDDGGRVLSLVRQLYLAGLVNGIAAR